MPPAAEVSLSPGQTTALDAHALSPELLLVLDVLAQRREELGEAHDARQVSRHVVQRGLEQKGLVGRKHGLLVEHVNGRQPLFGLQVLAQLVPFAIFVPDLAAVVLLAQEVRADFVVEQTNNVVPAVLHRQPHYDFGAALGLVDDGGGANVVLGEAVVD